MKSIVDVHLYNLKRMPLYKIKLTCVSVGTCHTVRIRLHTGHAFHVSYCVKSTVQVSFLRRVALCKIYWTLVSYCTKFPVHVSNVTVVMLCKIDYTRVRRNLDIFLSVKKDSTCTRVAFDRYHTVPSRFHTCFVDKYHTVQNCTRVISEPSHTVKILIMHAY